MERSLVRSWDAARGWVMLAALGVGLIVACSDEENTPGTPVVVGGEGGEPSPPRAGGGAGSSAGTGLETPGGAPSGGAAGEAGASGGGAGGAGGALLSVGEQCSSCGQVECETAVDRCAGSAACAPWLACLSACDSGDCVAACDTAHSEVSRIYREVYACLCQSCSESCSAVDACGKQTCVDDSSFDVLEVVPRTLAETGLFVSGDGAGGDGAGGEGGASHDAAIAPGVRTFEPRFPLWSDGAGKQRYIYIPSCSTIDSRDMDHWKFPVGTRLWKTFTVGQAAVETRLVHRFGEGAGDWMYAAYQWDPAAPTDPAAAKLVNEATGSPNANGSGHDIPSVGQCRQCHNGLPEKVLGFGAIQLSHDRPRSGLTMEALSDQGWLTHPARDGFQVPGTAVQRSALGYLHANCGNCHSDSTPTPGGDPQILRLSVAQLDYAQTDAVKTTVGIATLSTVPALAGKPRIDPKSPSTSTILLRMLDRAEYPMPALGTKVADTEGGVADVTAWINSLPAP